MQIQIANITNPPAEQAGAPVATPAIALFKFQNLPVRVVMIDGTEFFVAKDLTAILGFRNARQAVRSHVSKRDRRGVHLMDTIGRDQTFLAVNESGLYALIFGSTKPEAQEFKWWVTMEVLPTLRKTGRFEVRGAPALLQQIGDMLRGRGVSKKRQLNRIVAHRDGSFSFRLGRQWTRRVPPCDVSTGAPSHSLREGLALASIHLVQKAERRALVH